MIVRPISREYWGISSYYHHALEHALTLMCLVTEDQREALLDLLLTHGHAAIGPEVRKELLAGRGRGVPAEPEGPTFDGDDTMLLDS